MRFKRLIVENFGPFKEPTTIDFRDRDGVSIVWGRNGRGKTTLLNAFHFVLNGTVKDRNGKKNNFISFLNEGGKSEGRYTYKVTLVLTDNEKTYRIVRSMLPLPGVEDPTTNNEVQISLMVNRDGNILPSADAEHFVQSIMTPEVSRFFLFDGELLTEYEELLNESSDSGGSIKASIEQILGMPILTFGAIDAKTAAASIATEARKVAQNEEAVRKYAGLIEAQESILANHKKELARLKQEHEEKLLEKKTYQNLAEDTAKLRELLGRKNEIQGKMDNLLERRDYAKSDLSKILSDGWKWMVLPAVKAKNDDLQQEIELLREKEKTSRDQEIVITYIQKAISDAFCPVCEQDVTPAEKILLEEKLHEYQVKMAGLSPEEKGQLSTLRNNISILSKYLGQAEKTDDIRKQYDAYVSNQVKYTDLKEHDLKAVVDDLESLKKNASGADEKKAVEYYEKLGSIANEIREYEKGIESVEAEIQATNDQIDKFNNTIISKSKNKDVALANKKVAFANAIAEIFTKGIDVYRDKLSQDVERDATEIFLAMNTEDDYGGLKINENYGLTIIRKSDGMPVPKRSAGWEHMVAFALIGALHKNAPFDGPVIMDSPFYRLDMQNTASMVRALPLISHQVLMLPYPGEIDQTTTRNDIGPSIVQELVIDRISSNESTIKELSEDV